MNLKPYKIFAGKKTGRGSMDAQGFSSNGEFYTYLATDVKHAEKQFKKENKGYRIYDILGPRRR